MSGGPIPKLAEHHVLSSMMRAGRWCVQQRSGAGPSAQWRIASSFADEEDAQDTVRAMAQHGLRVRLVSPAGDIITSILTKETSSARLAAERGL